MREVTCSWCKEKSPKNEMIVEEKPTGKFNKSGSVKMSRKYTHKTCIEYVEKDKEFKRLELEKFDQLYQHLLKIHNLKVLDSRMLERLHDLRNGNVRVGSKKVKRYKEGLGFLQILQVYIYLNDQIQNVLHNKNFETKWNEFAYIMSIVVNKFNEVHVMLKQKEKQEIHFKKAVENISETHEVSFSERVNMPRKSDSMDISSFL